MNPKSWAMSVVGFSQVANSSLSLLQQVGVFVSTFFFQAFSHSLWGGAPELQSCEPSNQGEYASVSIRCLLP